jgi:hypothetical protein
MKYSDWKAKSDSNALNEALGGKTVVFTFGRFQPPTSGHQKLADALVSTASKVGGVALLYPSRTNDAKKNPLNPGVKIKWLRKFFGDKVKVMDDAGAKTMFDVMNKFDAEGVKKVIMVVGGDRVEEMKQTIKPYLTHKDPDKRYSFEFEVVSAGERDPDAEGVVGMSASKMRAAAAENNLKAFMGGIPNGVSESDAESLFKELRRAMSVKESIEFTPDSLVEVGEMQSANGLRTQFWLDEQDDIYYAVETDADGNSTEGGYGTLETMLSMYPGAWNALKGQLRATVSRRAKARRVDGDEFEESCNLKKWMLQLQSLKESGWGVIASMQYQMRTPCAQRALPLSALSVSSIVKKAHDTLQQEYELKKEFESSDDSSWKKRVDKLFYEFFALFTKAMKSKKESDWKQAQLFACKYEQDLALQSNVAALLTAGPG